MFTIDSRRSPHHWQKGFTMLELLIVVAIMGTLAGVVTPNVTSFHQSATVKAANTELANVKTAAILYYAEYSAWPTDTTVMADYLTGTPRATYAFDDATGFIIGASAVAWSGVAWSTPAGPPYTQHGEWTKP